MKIFDPIWISSDTQLAALVRTYTEATLRTKLLGNYSLRPGLAHMRGLFTPWVRMPLVFIAQGQLTLDIDSCKFAPRPRAPFGWRLHGGRPSLTFRLRPSDIVAVEPADFYSPVAGLFDLPFTRVRTTHAGVQGDLLLCVGGRINVPRIRARSLELRQALGAFAAEQAVTDF